MSNRPHIILLFVLINTVCAASGTEKLLERLRRFGQFVPQEKVYVHMDNTCYWLGDTLWFSAYTRQTSNDMPSGISRILYVELFNQDGYLMERQLIEMVNGRGHGNFVLQPSYYYGGYYELRAYTRWQLNWGGFERPHADIASRWFINDEKEVEYFRDYDKLYSRVFPVYDEPREKGELYHEFQPRAMRRYFKDDMDRHDLQLSLYPEGGALVRGVPCRIAFEATRGEGEWEEGVLRIGSETATTVHRGRGVITVCADCDNIEAVFVSAKGDSVKQKIPRPEAEGVTLCMRHSEGVWKARVEASSGLDLDSMAVSVMHEGLLSHNYRLSGNQTEISIPNNILPAGVNQITVFDVSGRVWADRLFFVTKPDVYRPTLQISGLEEKYAPFDSIMVRIQAVDSIPNARLSVAVRDVRHADNIYDNGNILTEMLLASEIKGFVPDPGWYFEADDEPHHAALDLLMMTQGWRRFRWRDMAVSGEWDIVHPAEQCQILFGRVTNPVGLDENDFELARDNSLGDGTLKSEVCVHSELISMLNVEMAKAEDMTSEKGRFRLTIPRFYGKGVFFLSAVDTSTWKSREQYPWIEVEPDEDDGHFSKMRHNIRFGYHDARDLRVCLDFPYPRFVKRYNHYQTHLMPRSANADNTLFAEPDVHNMREVEIRARHNGKRRFSDAAAVFSIDAYEAYNQAYDAGFIWFTQNGINQFELKSSSSGPAPYAYARMLVGDMGLERPYSYSFQPGKKSKPIKDSRIHTRYGANVFDWMTKDAVPEDSLYSLKYLESTSSLKDLTPREIREYSHLYSIDRFVVYTDYMPRLAGDKRYQGENLPDVDIVMYPYYDGAHRVTYRDRRLILPGLSIAADFYHPNYSERPLPSVKDYRRTLYWNPDLHLDEHGAATITLFNNSSETSVAVSVNGMDDNGRLLYAK